MVFSAVLHMNDCLRFLKNKQNNQLMIKHTKEPTANFKSHTTISDGSHHIFIITISISHLASKSLQSVVPQLSNCLFQTFFFVVLVANNDQFCPISYVI